MRREESLIDFISYRENKQKQAEGQALNLYTFASEFALRYSNIREKVRAKHLFRQQIHQSSDRSFSNELEDIYSQWFLFDYHTIQGETMFSLFLKHESNKLSEPEFILGALFLATYVEPYIIVNVDKDKGCLVVKECLEGKECTIKYINQNLDYRIGDYIMCRVLPLITYDYPVGIVFQLERTMEVNQLVHTYKLAKQSNPSLTWRTFLKRNGYIWLARQFLINSVQD
jgi:hypothetical protein